MIYEYKHLDRLYKGLDGNWEEYDHDFISVLKLDKSLAVYICEQTKKQSNCDVWYKFRQENYRINFP